ncbi:LysR family transcriptional regulator [Psychromonas sp. 14N.309.X.WAT.B.A12]|uniref:LysR family transcriptional regulator n=1 Tax=unclassified Psychromonas TaxID=2614957 RepID=UPI0025B0B75D|nr:LysR family transcriptional regulator [Psychromonas sp. 14N.309.X.WAT.B.A12]MDN2663826.1 LysR family transcriptional regulator [Psychromonas sp. 14N.309.X.WAT.B.A12]
MDIKLRPIRYFIAAAECGSLSEAANKLHISQPSISAAIIEIEKTLDLQLFVRYPSKGIRLTTQGMKVLEEARILIRHAESFRVATSAVKSQLIGNISIAFFMNLGSNYLSEIIRTFKEKYPDINVHIHDLDQAAIFDALSSGKVELALTFDLNIPKSMKAKYIATREPYALLPLDDPLAQQEEVELKDLVQRPYILMDLPYTNDYFISLFAKHKLSPNIRYRTNSFETVRTFVASGLGVSVLNLKPKSPVTYNGNQVVIKPIKDKVDPLNIVLVHYSRLEPRRIADIFSAHIESFFEAAS